MADVEPLSRCRKAAINQFGVRGMVIKRGFEGGSPKKFRVRLESRAIHFGDGGHPQCQDFRPDTIAMPERATLPHQQTGSTGNSQVDFSRSGDAIIRKTTDRFIEDAESQSFNRDDELLGWG